MMGKGGKRSRESEICTERKIFLCFFLSSSEFMVEGGRKRDRLPIDKTFPPLEIGVLFAYKTLEGKITLVHDILPL